MTDIIRVILYVGGDGAVHRRPGGRKAVPEWNALTYKVAHRGALFCSLASAQLGTIILWLRLLRQQRAASIALGSPPSLPPFCPRSPGSWVLGPDVLASAGPHTLPEHPSLADPSGLQCIYSTPNANTHEVSSNDDTSMHAWAMGYSPPSMAALLQGRA